MVMKKKQEWMEKNGLVEPTLVDKILGKKLRFKDGTTF
jgi:hypothetical protein